MPKRQEKQFGAKTRVRRRTRQKCPPRPPSTAPARRNGWQGRAVALRRFGLAEHIRFPLGRHSSSYKKDIVVFGEPYVHFQKLILEFPAPAIQLMSKRAAVLVAPFPLGLALFD